MEKLLGPSTSADFENAVKIVRGDDMVKLIVVDRGPRFILPWTHSEGLYMHRRHEGTGKPVGSSYVPRYLRNLHQRWVPR